MTPARIAVLAGRKLGPELSSAAPKTFTGAETYNILSPVPTAGTYRVRYTIVSDGGSGALGLRVQVISPSFTSTYTKNPGEYSMEVVVNSGSSIRFSSNGAVALVVENISARKLG